MKTLNSAFPMCSTSSLNPREMEPLVHLQHLCKSTFLFLSTLHTHDCLWHVYWFSNCNWRSGIQVGTSYLCQPILHIPGTAIQIGRVNTTYVYVKISWDVSIIKFHSHAQRVGFFDRINICWNQYFLGFCWSFHHSILVVCGKSVILTRQILEELALHFTIWQLTFF